MNIKLPLRFQDALILVITSILTINLAHAQCVPGETVTQTINTVGSGTFTIPAGVTSIRVQIWGAGGRGGNRSNDGTGGGGGGGAYSESTISVIGGNTYYYSVGQGSTSTNPGGDSWFSSSANVNNAIVLAKGGQSVGNNDSDGADGGDRRDGIGDIRYSGGDGGDGEGGDGGGGGSSASSTNDGQDGRDGDNGSTGGNGGSDSGSGGNGQESRDGNGADGTNPGGGGGGATRDQQSGTLTGGKGGDGQIIISYVCPSCGPVINYSANVQQFKVPAGVTYIIVEAWGGGGKGAGRDNDRGGGAGGGAGAYSRSTLTVTPGETLYFSTGTGSTGYGTPGGDSWISRNNDGSNALVRAKGGNSVSGNNATTGATGGLASQSIGDTKINGGNGDNGGNSNGTDGGDGGDSPNGGQGGQGGDNGNESGADGASPGGGGGGGKTESNSQTRNGGNGGNGLIKISYDCSVTNPSGCWRYIDDGSVSGVVIMEFFNDCNWEAPENLLEFEVLVVGGGGGGGAVAGGGGGAGGLVHARVDVAAINPNGLAPNTVFEIELGEGGTGSDNDRNKGGDGNHTHFDKNGIYAITAGGGGGGGSKEDRSGRNGSNSSIKNNTNGLSTVNDRLYGGSGGGAGEDGNDSERGQGGTNGNRGGRGRDNAGGGGGGVAENGQNADDDDGGDGGDGVIISEFDSRIFAAGGGGGGDDNRGQGGLGVNLRGGIGGIDNERGEDGQTPGSGGGGAGDNSNTIGGKGAKGVVIIRYEIAKILPVEINSFTVKLDAQNRESVLTWTTVKEWDNSHFEIERSVNDVKSWETIGTINGAGYSDQLRTYAYSDNKLPAVGGNVFYRLKQVDFNGNSKYSDTKSIRIEAVIGKGSWVAYPNPSFKGQYVHIDLLNSTTHNDEPIYIQLSNSSGTSITSIQVDKPSEVEKTINTFIEQQNTGIFVVKLNWGDFSEILKIQVK